MPAWDPAQIRMFAKQIADSPEGDAWWAFPSVIREAIISHRVLQVVFSQRAYSTRAQEAVCAHGREALSVDDVRELRIAIERRLAEHHNMKTRE
jgi:hypothetical protein